MCSDVSEARAADDCVFGSPAGTVVRTAGREQKRACGRIGERDMRAGKGEHMSRRRRGEVGQSTGARWV
jgi:hypothetical protein